MAVSEERVALLVEDLVHGGHKKGKGRLHTIVRLPDGTTESRWCCLGRAGAVACLNGLDVSRKMVPDGSGAQAEMIGDSLNYLSREIMEWYGFEEDNPVLITPGGAAIAATGWNDVGIAIGEDGLLAESTLAEIGEGFRRTFLEKENERLA